MIPLSDGEDPTCFENRYEELPCKCGYTPTNNPDEWLEYRLNMGDIVTVDNCGNETKIPIGYKRALKCRNCQETSLLQRKAGK